MNKWLQTSTGSVFSFKYRFATVDVAEINCTLMSKLAFNLFQKIILILKAHDGFRYYCSYQSDNFKETIQHCLDIHPDLTLKIRKRQLDTATGKLRLRSMNFNLIPSNVHSLHKTIHTVDSGTISIEIISNSDLEANWIQERENSGIMEERGFFILLTFRLDHIKLTIICHLAIEGTIFTRLCSFTPVGTFNFGERNSLSHLL